MQELGGDALVFPTLFVCGKPEPSDIVEQMNLMGSSIDSERIVWITQWWNAGFRERNSRQCIDEWRLLYFVFWRGFTLDHIFSFMNRQQTCYKGAGAESAVASSRLYQDLSVTAFLILLTRTARASIIARWRWSFLQVAVPRRLALLKLR